MNYLGRIYMIGINIDNLEMIIKKNNLYSQSFNSNSKKLESSISDLNSCYSGNSLQYLFSEPMKAIENLRVISTVVENYSNVLYAVKCSYQKQDETFKNQLNHINSNL